LIPCGLANDEVAEEAMVQRAEVPAVRAPVSLGGKVIVVSLPLSFTEAALARFQRDVARVRSWKASDGPWGNGAMALTFATTMPDDTLVRLVQRIYGRCFATTVEPAHRPRGG
jgi:hypothetical protein